MKGWKTSRHILSISFQWQQNNSSILKLNNFDLIILFEYCWRVQRILFLDPPCWVHYHLAVTAPSEWVLWVTSRDSPSDIRWQLVTNEKQVQWGIVQSEQTIRWHRKLSLKCRQRRLWWSRGHGAGHWGSLDNISYLENLNSHSLFVVWRRHLVSRSISC